MLKGFAKYWKQNLIFGVQRSWKWLGVGGKIMDVVVGFIAGFLLGEKDILRISIITIGVALSLFGLLSLIFIVFIVPFQENLKLEKMVSNLKAKRKEPPTLIELSKLRKVGIELRNRGMSLSNEEELKKWITEFETWNKRIVVLSKKISKTKASIIETLGDFAPIRNYSTAINGLHRLKLNVFDEKLKRLQSLLEEFAP